MHADELRTAIHRVVEVLNRADILAVVKEYRTARGDQRTVAAARLGHSGAVIMECMDQFSPTERAVANCMFLDSLGTTEYWQGLLETTADPSENAAELVHLFSRVMFASTHLPNLATLLGSVTSSASAAAGSAATALPANGEGRLSIRLTDAGERASDPDRIARSIDGIDMLYSACASIARKPAMDLRLDGISGGDNRDVHFMGERDSISAVDAVISSIPEALAEIHPDDEIDLDELIESLPIFEDLNTLANLGTFTPTDLNDISETMHQGAMLILESGVTVVDEVEEPREKPSQLRNVSTPLRAVDSNAATVNAAPPILTRRPAEEEYEDELEERDEHYERYLREREALERGEPAPRGQMSQAKRTAEVDDLLKNLGRSRDR